MRRFAAVLPALLLLGLAQCTQAPPAQEDVVVYLVRHAERAEDGTSDPPISEAGQQRSQLVAEMLRDAGITHVHSTDYQRTRSTATPAAQGAGLDILSYDPSDLPAFAARLLATPGRHLVVGHSNTTNELVEALGGEPGAAIDEFEYDRLYVVVASPNRVETVLLRFGSGFQP